MTFIAFRLGDDRTMVTSQLNWIGGTLLLLHRYLGYGYLLKATQPPSAECAKKYYVPCRLQPPGGRNLNPTPTDLGKGCTVKGVLLDITGNICNSIPNGVAEAIPGSLDAIKRLTVAKIPFRLVTNETQLDRQRLCDRKLRSFGLNIEMNHVFSPAPAVANAIRSRGLRPHLLVFPELLPEFDGIDTTSPNCVVVGDAEHHFTYDNLNAAFQVLIGLEHPILLSMGKGKYYKEGGELVLDLGAYTAALEYACQVKAEIFGKPEKDFYLAALRDMGVEPQDAVMVGDDIESDVGGAQKCGLKGILVRTGKFRPSDENHPTVKPDAIVDNLAAAVDLILS